MKYLVLVFMLVVASVSVADWSENFDSYADGSGLIGQGGWEGWDGDTAPDAYVTTTQFISAPHGIDIEPTSDVVQEFDITAGSWVITAWNYIPTGSCSLSDQHPGDTNVDAGICGAGTNPGRRSHSFRCFPQWLAFIIFPA